VPGVLEDLPGSGKLQWEQEQRERADDDDAEPERLAGDDNRLRRDERRRSDAQRERDEDRRGEAQYAFDRVYQAVKGERAPPPMALESSNHYRRRMLAPLLKYSTDWKNADIWKIAPAVLDIAERQIRADAQRIGNDPSAMQEFEGERASLREVRTPDATGRMITRFYGPVSATIDPFRMQPMRVKRFITNPNQL
jgi:hypothetical protein